MLGLRWGGGGRCAASPYFPASSLHKSNAVESRMADSGPLLHRDLISSSVSVPRTACIIRRAVSASFDRPTPTHTPRVFRLALNNPCCPTKADALITIFQMAETDASTAATVARDGRVTSVAGDGEAPADGQGPPGGAPGPMATTPTDVHVVSAGAPPAPQGGGAAAPGTTTTTADGAPDPQGGEVAPAPTRPPYRGA